MNSRSDKRHKLFLDEMTRLGGLICNLAALRLCLIALRPDSYREPSRPDFPRL